MPVKPQPMLIRCRQCGWETSYAPPSDALVMPPPQICGKCGSPKLDSKPASILHNIVSIFSSLTGKKTPLG